MSRARGWQRLWCWLGMHRWLPEVDWRRLERTGGWVCLHCGKRWTSL